MSILLTGFEPFDGASVNPSWEAVQRVPDQICGHEVHRLRLPVVYGQAAALLLTYARPLRPEIILCCGVAGGREGGALFKNGQPAGAVKGDLAQALIDEILAMANERQA